MPRDGVRRPQNRQLTPLPPSGQRQGGGQPVRRRLQGDDLYTWAVLQNNLRRAQQDINDFVNGVMQNPAYGIAPNEGLDGAGYIIQAQQGPIPVQVDQSGGTGGQDDEGRA
jgi:hypothetical protein